MTKKANAPARKVESAWRLRRPEARHVGDLLPFFDPFGRKPEDEETERDLVRYLPAAAEYYNALIHPPRASVIRGQLDKAHKALWRAELALRALSAPAADYVLDYEPEVAPYLTAASEGGAPRARSEAFEDVFDLALGQLAEAFHARNDEMLLKADLASRSDSSDFRRFERACLELHSAREDLQGARDEIDRALRRSGEGDVLSRDAIKALRENRDAAARRVEAAEAVLDRAVLFHGPAPVLPPYVILDAKAAEIGNLRALLEMALDRFDGDRRRAAPTRGRKGGMRPRMPRDVLAEMMVQLIGRFWRAKGLDCISPTPMGDGDNKDSRAGKFQQLLVAFHFYACGEDLSGEDAEHPRRRPDGSEISGRPFAEALEKVSEYVQAERARLKVLARKSRAEKKRRERAVAEARERLNAGGRPSKGSEGG